jgi:hypothetical protein
VTWTPQAAPTSAKPPVSQADLWISIAALILTVLVGGGAAVMGLFLLAFFDSAGVIRVAGVVGYFVAVGAGAQPI